MKIKGSVRLGIVLAVLAAVLLLIPQPQGALAQQKFKLKFQAAWPAGLTLYENFVFFAERVKKMSGGRLIIETLPAGAIVPPFELLDATSRGVVDGAHIWAAYWVGKNKAAVLFTGGPGGTHGMDFVDAMGLSHPARRPTGLRLVQKAR
jgi:TRAP-type mannitol/chloroaromatic compound transport system substrate-binding protein